MLKPTILEAPTMIRKPIPTAWLILMNSRWSATHIYQLACEPLLQSRIATEHTLGASLDEQRTVADEVLGDIGDLLESVGHGDGGSGKSRCQKMNRRIKMYSNERNILNRKRIPRHEETATIVQESEGDLDICLDGEIASWPSGPEYLFCRSEGGGSGSVPATTTNVSSTCLCWNRVLLPTAVEYRRILYRNSLLAVCRGLV